LDNKVSDIIDARCNHDDQEMPITSTSKIVSQLLSKIMKIKICKTITFHRTLYWCEPRYLSLREEHIRRF